MTTDVKQRRRVVGKWGGGRVGEKGVGFGRNAGEKSKPDGLGLGRGCLVNGWFLFLSLFVERRERTPFLSLQFQHLFFIFSLSPSLSFSLSLPASQSICHRCPTQTFCIIVSTPQLLSNWCDHTQSEEKEEEDGVWILVLGLVLVFSAFG